MNASIPNKSLLSSLICILMIGLMSCNKEDDNEVTPLDKKIVFDLYSNNPGYSSGADTTIYSTNVLMLDKKDYANITSAKLVLSNLSTQSYMDGSDINAKIIVDLVDLTHNQPIPGSAIQTDNIPASAVVSSVDFLNNIPSTPFNLGIRIINPDPTKVSWRLYAASLVLQR
ncbi:hypothetical protein [Adhaeribacter soli]|uniref:Uncharacterized protein n=1 Tax=Adhaeribacter soli TaxID=2607655 RepID=A0A5N1IJV4_9BACT|nr:hypothetical protein [Adhaeribacter soli]KAA9325416.1 hypothetical protein F0P94_17670 [Adhaeribacter soli]